MAPCPWEARTQAVWQMVDGPVDCLEGRKLESKEASRSVQAQVSGDTWEMSDCHSILIGRSKIWQMACREPFCTPVPRGTVSRCESTLIKHKFLNTAAFRPEEHRSFLVASHHLLVTFWPLRLLLTWLRGHFISAVKAPPFHLDRDSQKNALPFPFQLL